MVSTRRSRSATPRVTGDSVTTQSAGQGPSQPLAPSAMPDESSQVMGPARSIRAYTGEKLNGKNWGAFEFGFKAHLIGYNLVQALERDMEDEGIQNKVFSVLIAALESSQYPLVNKTRAPAATWAALKSFYRKQSGQSRLLLTQRFRHAKMIEGEDLYTHLTTMSNLAEELDEVTGTNITNEDFMTTICFSIMGIPRYANIVEIIMNGAILSRLEVINKLTATEQRQNTIGGAPTLEPQTAMRAQTRGKTNTQKKGKCFKCGKIGHFAKQCRSTRRTARTDTEKRSPSTPETANTATTEFLFATTFGESPDNHQNGKESWILDSGASAHMVCSFDQLIDPRPIERPTAVVLGDGRELAVTHRGDALVRPNVRLTNVLYVPGLQENLFSVTTAASRPGVKVVMEDGACRVTRDGKEAIIARNHGGIFRIAAATAHTKPTAADASVMNLHRRCGHVNFRTIGLMSKMGILPQVEIDEATTGTQCETCLKGKMTRTAIPTKATEKVTQLGDIIHSDLCGPMRTRSLQGNSYMVTYMDDASGWIHAGFIREKSQQLREFKALEATLERQRGIKIKCLRSDGGGEYNNKETLKYLRSKGIQWQHSAPRTPQQNGRAERLNRTLTEMARCLMIDADLSPGYWQYATTMAIYIRNRTPTASNRDMLTPFELVWGHRPIMTNLPLFGATALVHVPDALRRKLDAKTRDCIFLGYAMGSKAGVFEEIGTKKLIVSRDAVIDGIRIDNDFGTSTASGLTNNSDKEEPKIKTEVGSNTGDDDDEPVPAVKTDTDLPGRRPRRAPIRYMYEWAHSTSIDDGMEPESVQKALNSKSWRNAMKEEYEALTRNGTWELVPEPADRSVVSGKWCFKAKVDADGNVHRYKARYVARGYTQRPGIDYMETTSPVVSMTSLRTLLSVATMEDMEVKQLDVDSAFLYGELNEEIYLQQPQGFEKFSKDGERLVCRLRKAIYGLKQAGRVWWKLIDSELRRISFESSNEDSCIYRRQHDGNLVLIAIYVDDLIIASRSSQQISNLERTLKGMFSMKPMGDITYVLGMKIGRDRSSRTMYMSQSAYAKAILEKYQMMDCRPVQAPVAAGSCLEPHDGPEAQFPYAQVVGSLMYLAMGTRPDLAFGVGLVSRFTSNPGDHHVKAVKRLLRYLRGTIDIGLRWGGSPDTTLACWADADYAGCMTTRRSTTGYVIMLNGGAISWASRRQECAALSTTEAEYMALCSATKEVAWLRGLLEFVGFPEPAATTIYQDNQSTIALAENGRVSRRSKHIEVRFHFTRGKITDGTIRLNYCPTNNMIADAMTKALPQNIFGQHCAKFLKACPNTASSGGSVEEVDDDDDDGEAISQIRGAGRVSSSSA